MQSKRTKVKRARVAKTESMSYRQKEKKYGLNF